MSSSKKPNKTKQDESKEIHTETQCNEIVKSQRQRENFENSKRKVTCHV